MIQLSKLGHAVGIAVGSIDTVINPGESRTAIEVAFAESSQETSGKQSKTVTCESNNSTSHVELFVSFIVKVAVTIYDIDPSVLVTKFEASVVLMPFMIIVAGVVFGL